MQAQLTVRRSPSILFFAVFVVAAAALLLGGTLGYVLKPAATITAPARVIVVHDESPLFATTDSLSPYSDGCVWAGHVKSC